jgi:hypothetical protein
MSLNLAILGISGGALSSENRDRIGPFFSSGDMQQFPIVSIYEFVILCPLLERNAFLIYDSGFLGGG